MNRRSAICTWLQLENMCIFPWPSVPLRLFAVAAFAFTGAKGNEVQDSSTKILASIRLDVPSRLFALDALSQSFLGFVQVGQNEIHASICPQGVWLGRPTRRAKGGM